MLLRGSVPAWALVALSLLNGFGTGTPRVTAAEGWDWPLAGDPKVVRAFDPPPERWLAGHRGVDLLGSPGQPVLAAGAGRVSFAGWVAGRPVVVVAHAAGLRTSYEPVLPLVRRNKVIHAGDVIGALLGAPGHCLPRTCLHWGLRQGATYLDPLSLVGAGTAVRLLPVWGASPPWPKAVGVDRTTDRRQLNSPVSGLSAAEQGALNRMQVSAYAGNPPG